MPYPRLRSRWAESVHEIKADDPAVRRLIDRIAPDAEVTELGGWMSRNLRLTAAGGATDVVLRIHPRYVTPRRLLALQDVRRRLVDNGLTAPTAIEVDGTTVLRCGVRAAELERFLPHRTLEPTPANQAWLFRQMGLLHRVLLPMDRPMPRPALAHFAPPDTLRHWTRAARGLVDGHPAAADFLDTLAGLIERLRARWPRTLPDRLVHGDVKLPNICPAPDGRTIIFDVGQMARRPRIYELAFTCTHTLFLPEDTQTIPEPEDLPLQRIPSLVAEYEEALGDRLSDQEWGALATYLATMPLYWSAGIWFMIGPEEAAGELDDEHDDKRAVVRLSTWLLDHPEAIRRPPL